MKPMARPAKEVGSTTLVSRRRCPAVDLRSRNARRSTSERLDEARRAASRCHLIAERVTEATADAWIAAWDVQAAENGLEHCRVYWERGWEWIAAERQRRVRP